MLVVRGSNKSKIIYTSRCPQWECDTVSKLRVTCSGVKRQHLGSGLWAGNHGGISALTWGVHSEGGDLRSEGWRAGGLGNRVRHVRITWDNTYLAFGKVDTWGDWLPVGQLGVCTSSSVLCSTRLLGLSFPCCSQPSQDCLPPSHHSQTSVLMIM